MGAASTHRVQARFPPGSQGLRLRGGPGTIICPSGSPLLLGRGRSATGPTFPTPTKEPVSSPMPCAALRQLAPRTPAGAHASGRLRNAPGTWLRAPWKDEWLDPTAGILWGSWGGGRLKGGEAGRMQGIQGATLVFVGADHTAVQGRGRLEAFSWVPLGPRPGLRLRLVTDDPLLPELGRPSVLSGLGLNRPRSGCRTGPDGWCRFRVVFAPHGAQ